MAESAQLAMLAQLAADVRAQRRLVESVVELAACLGVAYLAWRCMKAAAPLIAALSDGGN